MNSISGVGPDNKAWAAQSALKERQAKAQAVNEPKLEDAKRKGSPSIAKNGEADFAQALKDVHRPEADDGQKGRGLIEVSLRDPWPPDDPLRAECDRFLKIFEGTYHEVLAEMGLAPESSDYAAIVMSKKDLNEIARRMVEKLKANPEARELMSVLQVDFSGDVKTGPDEKNPGRKPAGHNPGERLDEADEILFEELRERYQTLLAGGRSEFFDFWTKSIPKDAASAPAPVSKPLPGPGLTQGRSAWIKPESAPEALADNHGFRPRISKTA